MFESMAAPAELAAPGSRRDSVRADSSTPAAAGRDAERDSRRAPLQVVAAQRLGQLMAESVPLRDPEGLLRLRSPEPARRTLTRIAAMAPSAESLAALHAIDPQRLNAYDRVNWLTEWERHRGWFDAHAQRGIVAVGGASPPVVVGLQPDSARDDIGREQVALALRVSSATGGGRLDVARELTGRLTRTLASLGAGELSYWHAKAVADAAGPLADAAALAVERAALDGAPPFETLTQFRARVARAVIAADPPTADEQHLTAVAGRRVVMWPEPHGMATVQATLTADEAVTAMTALTALAGRARHDGDDRPVDVLRADAFSAVFDAALADPQLPVEQRSRPRIGITIDSATLMGLAEHPGHLDGYGPIPPVLARRIAAGGDWHRLVTDPISGALLDYGSTVYRPPADLVEFLTARDRTCRMPTCARPARLCDLDHADPFDQSGRGHGGATSSANCGAACRRNHRQKTAGDILLRSHPDGSATWTTQAGHTYHRAAIDHCPEHTAHLRQLRELRAREAAQREAERDAAAADRDGQQADARWDNPHWVNNWTRAHAPHHTAARNDGDDHDDHGPSDDDGIASAETADESAATARAATAEEAAIDDPHSQTTSGNDPPAA